MVIRLGRNGRFLACSLYPEHKESRPLPGEEPETRVLPGEGEPCPVCGEGTLVQKRGRFGPFVGCSRYPECTYIHKDGPLPPEQLPFEVTCPTCKEGHLVARRARRTGNVFWGCSRYPRCRFTTSREPVGAVHDADGGPVARNTDGTAVCLACGAPVSLPDHVEVGEALAGGPPDATALAPVGRRGGRAGGTRSTKGRAGGSRSGGSRTLRAAKPRRDPPGSRTHPSPPRPSAPSDRAEAQAVRRTPSLVRASAPASSTISRAPGRVRAPTRRHLRACSRRSRPSA